MIFYTEGYKYQLKNSHVFDIGEINDALYPPDAVDRLDERHWEISPFLKLYPSGKVVQLFGYAWDGASGPTLDDKTNQVPALEHDGLYQILRKGVLPLEKYRKLADERLDAGLKERGMNFFRRWLWFRAVRKFGKSSATQVKKVYKAK